MLIYCYDTPQATISKHSQVNTLGQFKQLHSKRANTAHWLMIYDGWRNDRTLTEPPETVIRSNDLRSTHFLIIWLINDNMNVGRNDVTQARMSLPNYDVLERDLILLLSSLWRHNVAITCDINNDDSDVLLQVSTFQRLRHCVRHVSLTRNKCNIDVRVVFILLLCYHDKYKPKWIRRWRRGRYNTTAQAPRDNVCY